jgi:hypothetical protein
MPQFAAATREIVRLKIAPSKASRAAWTSRRSAHLQVGIRLAVSSVDADYIAA